MHAQQLVHSKMVRSFLSTLKKKDENYWVMRGQKRFLSLFQNMARRVPAYRDFLRKNGVRCDAITSMHDFVRLPLTSKENYLRAYPLSDLCWDGKLYDQPAVYAATSGSTGEPFYFPRTHVQDEQFRFTLELLLRDFFMVDRRKTLFINCFALGIWIGGMYMYQALKYLVDANEYALTVITPGAYKEEALKAIKKFGNSFDQIVIGGYAPLVKDLIDDGERMGISWKKYYTRFFFAAEGFSEDFRDYMHRACGLSNPFISSFNHYGTADMGTMAHETPVSIMLRRLSAEHATLRDKLFIDPSKQPTLCQFLPELFFFEQIDNGLVCSSGSGLPLIRYDLKDVGGVLSTDKISNAIQEEGMNWDISIEQLGLRDYYWHVPYVYVYERRDLTVSIYSVNIYPESIRRVLERPAFAQEITTKFSLKVTYDEHQNQIFEIHVERKNGVMDTEDLRVRLQKEIIDQLNEENSEWRDFYADQSIRHKIVPHITTWEYQHPEYFKPGTKQKWIKK